MRTLSGHQLRPDPLKDDDPGLADLRSQHSAVSRLTKCVEYQLEFDLDIGIDGALATEQRRQYP